jgi:hypothetical protein
MWPLGLLFGFFTLIFSSPELKAQVSYSDRLLSVVRLSCRPSVPYILAYKSVFWELNFDPKVYVRLIGEISEDRYFSERLGVVFSCFKNRSRSVFKKY